MDGIIIVNKEKGWTSNDVVQKIKGIVKEKTGHTGTLDPLATGVLPILVGKGTCLSKYLINHDKEYIATIRLGKKTSTGDIEGKLLEEQQVTDKMLEKENVEKVLKTFIGKQNQTPPMYSAIKVHGKKLYEYARKGEKVEVKPREIEIYDIKLISISKSEKKITYKVNCSKGTYIRTLCEDISKKLKTVGFMENLKRTKVGDFEIKQSITITEREKNINNNLITIEQFFHDKDKIVLNNTKLKLFLNGAKIEIDCVDNVYRVYNENQKFIGIAIVKNNIIKRDIVL